MRIERLAKEYYNMGSPMIDTVRGGIRVEIPALFSLGLEGEALTETLEDNVMELQKDDGSWNEKPYPEKDEKVGCWGAVPTAFSVISLVNGYLKTKEKEFLHSAVHGCDFLYGKERNGRFQKSEINRTDALNTNVLCAVALNETAKILDRDSQRIPIYKGAIGRAVCRTIFQQNLNGSYPYAGNGFKTSDLYHLMTLSLLLYIHRNLQSKLLGSSVKRGYDFYKRNRTRTRPLEEAHKDGCCWKHAWAGHPCVILDNDYSEFKKMEKNPGFGVGKDLFYTSWCMLPMYLTERQGKAKLRRSIWSDIESVFNSAYYSVFRNASNLLRQLQRKASPIDLGAIEHW